MAELIINRDNFENEVLGSDMPVLIDFWAPWCGPCRMLSPIIEELAKEYEGKVKVCKVNVDDETALAGAFRVASIPNLVFIKEGKVVSQSAGFRQKKDIVKLMEA